MAPPPAKKQRRLSLCTFEGCPKRRQSGGLPFCSKHGGGRRCTWPGCGKGVQADSVGVPSLPHAMRTGASRRGAALDEDAASADVRRAMEAALCELRAEAEALGAAAAGDGLACVGCLSESDDDDE